MPFVSEFLTLAPYLAASVIAVFVAWELVRDLKGNRSRIPLAGAMVSLGVWSLLNFLEDGSSLAGDKLAFSNAELWFSGAVPVLFFLFAVSYATNQRGTWRTSWWLPVVLGLYPLAIDVAALVQPIGGWVRHGAPLVALGGRWSIQEQYTPFFWGFVGYGYALMVSAFVVWAIRTASDRSKRYWSVFGSFVAVAVAAVVQLLSVLGLDLWGGHDLTAPAFTLTGIAFWVALERNQFLSVLPTARETVMESWPGPLAVFDSRGALAFFNQRAGEIWNLNPQFLGRKRRDLSIDLASPTTKPLADPATGQFWKIEERPLVEHGGRRGTLVAGHDVTGFVTRVSDELQHRRRTEEQVFYYSLHDSLTGLANRSLFLSRLEKAMDKARVSGQATFAVVILDFNDFNQINVGLGHAAGDEFLVQVGLRLAETTRADDTVARSTADRFLVLLNEVKAEAALWEAAERIRSSVEAPITLMKASVIPSVRMGLLLGTTEGTTPEMALGDAEIALERTGKNGAVSAVLFQPSWRVAQHERRYLKKDLEDAIVQGDLHLLFQPIVDLKTRRIGGFEALSRWNHRTRGTVPPDVFIPLAEAEGTIHPLGLWVLREASHLFVELGRRFPSLQETFVAVNVSPLQLIDADFVPILLGILAREGLDPARLHLEITETSLVEGSGRILPVFETLRREGVKIKLDDFGTGYSSLNSLHRLPVDSLKIDQSFVRELPGGRPIVKMILGLANELGLDVVAEGVETRGQDHSLTELACQAGQGYLYSKGWTGEALEALYTRDPAGPRFV